MTDEGQPPQNLEAEAALLGACLLAPEAIDAATDVVTDADFYRPAHGQILAAAVHVRDSGVQPDALTIAAELTRRGELVRLGGLPYLHTLMERVPTTVNAGWYAEQIRDAAIRRRVMAAGQRAAQLASVPGDAEEILERARASFDMVAEDVRAGVETAAIDDLGLAALLRYGAENIDALGTPWHDLDACLNGGLRPGTLTVIGARPGVGKSVMAGNLCTYAAQGGTGSLFISLEMPREEVTDRIISALARVHYSNILRRKLTDQDMDRVQNAVDKLEGLPLHVMDQPYITLTRIRSLARTTARAPYGLGLLVVDYLQLIQPSDTRVSRQEQVAGFSRGLKLLAKELRIPVVALAQLNRGPEQRSDRKPTLSDLRESGGIEQDADTVILLHRPDADDPRAGELDAILAKNRGGSTSTVTLAWAPHHQQVQSMAADR